MTWRPWKSSLIGDGISLHDCSGKRPRLRTRAFSVLQWVCSFLFSWVLGSRKYPQSLTGGISVCIIIYRPQRLEHQVTPQDVLSRPVEGKRKTPGSFDRGFFRCIISSPNQQRQESATEGGPKPRGPPFVRLHGLDYAAKGDDRANHREADSALKGFWKAAESVSYGIDEGIQESNHVPLLFRHGQVEGD